MVFHVLIQEAPAQSTMKSFEVKHDERTSLAVSKSNFGDIFLVNFLIEKMKCVVHSKLNPTSVQRSVSASWRRCCELRQWSYHHYYNRHRHHHYYYDYYQQTTLDNFQLIPLWNVSFCEYFSHSGLYPVRAPSQSKAAAQLIQDEDMKVGTVEWKIYFTYLGAVGCKWPLIVFIFSVFSVAFTLISRDWLAMWSTDRPGPGGRSWNIRK